MSHIYHLMKLAFEFVVVPDAYIVHLSHAPSLDISQFRKKRTYRVSCFHASKRLLSAHHEGAVSLCVEMS